MCSSDLEADVGTSVTQRYAERLSVPDGYVGAAVCRRFGDCCGDRVDAHYELCAGFVNYVGEQIRIFKVSEKVGLLHVKTGGFVILGNQAPDRPCLSRVRYPASAKLSSSVFTAWGETENSAANSRR